MENVNLEIIYWEGGDSYRPFIVVKADPKWPIENMAYYKSSGRSNLLKENEANYRRETWFPTLGLLKRDTILFQELQKKDPSLYTNGYILKDSVYLDALNGNMAKWFKVIMNDQNIMFNEKYNV